MINAELERMGMGMGGWRVAGAGMRETLSRIRTVAKSIKSESGDWSRASPRPTSQKTRARLSVDACLAHGHFHHSSLTGASSPSLIPTLP